MLPILLILLTLIIAGAIARQGLLSAFLHMICVISAGALALGLWEPVGFGLMDSVGGFAPYMAGTSLAMLFLSALVALRLSMDKLVPNNLNFNKTVDWIGASVFGFTGALLSVGIVTIAAGMLQFGSEGFGYTGWARMGGNGRPDKISGTPMIPASLTTGFYEFLSTSSLAPVINGGALAQRRPDLDRSSWSLVRDSYAGNDGNTRTWLQPKSITIPAKGGAVYSGQFDPAMLNSEFPRFSGAYILTIDINVSGFDNGKQFTLSAAQARLIAPSGTSKGKARVAFPMLYGQPTKNGPGFFAFDDASNYVTSMSGKQKLSFQLVFPAKDIGAPLANKDYFLEIKGLRIELPKIEVVDGAPTDIVSGGSAPQNLPSGGGTPLGGNDLEFTTDIRLRLSYNNRGGLQITDEKNLVIRGSGEFNSGAPATTVSPKLRVNDFQEDIDTRIVQLAVTRGGRVDTEQLKRAGQGDDALVLVDSQGETYYPTGYIRQGPKKTQISFDPAAPIRSINTMPSIPSAGTTTLYLIYRVPVGVTLREVRAGDSAVASMNRVVPPPK